MRSDDNQIRAVYHQRTAFDLAEFHFTSRTVSDEEVEDRTLTTYRNMSRQQSSPVHFLFPLFISLSQS